MRAPTRVTAGSLSRMLSPELRRARVSFVRPNSTSAVANRLVAADFLQILRDRKVDAFYGVPDSLLKDFAGFISDQYAHQDQEKHIITANEATAVGLAAGYYLSTSQPACVYLQNSGLGNVVNPIMSMAHERVYGIPMLLLIGWRGEPGVKDEPQHNFMGEQTVQVLESMQVQHAVLPDTLTEAADCISEAVAYMTEHNAPYAILVRKNTFAKYKAQIELVEAQPHWLTREAAIKLIADTVGSEVAIVSATGMPSRELYEHRVATFGEAGATGRDFLTVGSMGCCSSIALGVALGNPQKQVIALDGDGGTIMHMGALITNGQKAPPNFKHIVLNNGAHDSVGGQPSMAFDFDLAGMAQAAGYKVRVVDTAETIKAGCEWLCDEDGPVLLEVRTKTGARSDLGRPKSTPAQNKEGFMGFVSAL